MASAQRDLRAGRSASGLADDARVEDVLDAVPSLAGRTGWQRLSGGLTNVNIRVHRPDGDVVARIATDDSALLAIDRAAEHANSVAAATTGVAPEVVGYEPEVGVLVVRWVEGRTLSATDVGRPATLARLAAACRTLHAGPRFVGDFDMFAVQRGYLDVVRDRGFRTPVGYLDHMPRFEEVRCALAVRARGTVPCHNDLLAENLVDDGERLWLIDYEYGGNNDACFELGNIWSESALPPEALDTLVEAYHGTPSRSLVARARLYGLAAKYGWTLWAAIQSAASTVEVDFWSWGMEKYERAVAEFDGPDLDRLLEEVTAPD